MTDERRKLDLVAEELERLMKDRFERPMPKRFYKNVYVEGVRAPWSIRLDRGLLKTPMRATLELPTRALADAVAEEWRRQEEVIDPFDMPLTRLSNAAIDRVRGRRRDVIGAICAYGAHDLLCYRADSPLAFVHLQRTTWDPLLAWGEKEIGGRFVVSEGVMPAEQPSETLQALANRYSVFGDFQLAALNNMATLSASAILPLAVARGRISPEEAWEAANLEEAWNIRQWGEDPEALARTARRRLEFLSAAELLDLLKRP